MNAPYRHGDGFAGIGGFGLAARNVGWSTVWACEIEPSARLIYGARLGRDGLRFDRDIRFSRDIPELDILTGGFPCQDLSVAGKREGLAGERSGLFHHLARILHAVRPEWFVFENVPGLLSSHQGRDMQTVLHGCSGFCPAIPEGGWGTAGGIVGPAYAVVWRVLNSQFFGVAQRRRRVFLVGHSSGDIRRAFEVLFEREGVRRDSSEIGEAGREIAHCVTRRTHKGGDPTTDQYVVAPLTQRAYGDGATDDPPLVAGAIGTMGPGGGWRIGADEAARNQLVAHSLRAEGFDASEDGTGRGTPLVAPTLRCGGMADAKRPAGAGSDNVPIVAFQCNGSNVGPAGTLRAGNGNETGGVPFLAVAFNPQAGGSANFVEGTNPYTDALGCSQTPAVAIRTQNTSSNGCGIGELAHTLNHAEPDAIYCPSPDPSRVRAPSELPGSLDLCPSCTEGPDSPRYRGLGNAVTVNTVQWVLQRIEEQRRMRER